MKSTPLVAALMSLAIAGCATREGASSAGANPANAPLRPAEVMPPQCGLAPVLPNALAQDPGFKGATATVGFNLAPSGELSAIRLVKSAGVRALDEAALAAVRLWRCPAAPRRTIVLPAEVPLEFKPAAVQQSDEGRR